MNVLITGKLYPPEVKGLGKKPEQGAEDSIESKGRVKKHNVGGISTKLAR